MIKCIEETSQKLGISVSDVTKIVSNAGYKIPSKNFSPTNFVMGPVGLTELYHPELDTTIYLFSDFHFVVPDQKLSSGDLRIDDFILQTIKENSDIPIDIFIEDWLPFPNEKKEEKINKEGVLGYSNMFYVVNSLRRCLSFDKTKCEFKNVRAHSIDVRGSNRYCFNINDLFEYPDLEQVKNNPPEEMFDHVISVMEKTVELWKESDSVVEFAINACSKDKINKQEKWSELGVKFKSFLLKKGFDKNFFELWFLRLEKKLALFKKNKFRHIRNMVRMRIDATNLMKPISTILLAAVDYYFILRLFRKYKPIPGKYSGRARNVIVYAGKAHTDAYELFLKELGFQKRAEYSSTLGEQKIDLTNFNQPFFSQVNRNTKWIV